MSTTPRAALPLLAAAQAQKHVTHNDALCQLDALVNAQLLDRDLTAPPASPADGDTYLVKATATGAWAGQDGRIAYCLDGGWQFYAPFAGLIAHVADENTLIVYDGSAWADLSSMVPLQNVALVGVNTTADSTNKLAVKSAAVLLDNTGNGVQAKLNKATAADTASFLYQTGYSGRAEIGLCGDDDFHFKVSPDGASWTDALVLDKTSGLLTLAGDPTADAHAATKKYVDDHAGGGGGAPHSVQVFTASGTWTRPSGVTAVIIEAVGGGGSGGSAVANAGAGGGGAGGYSKKLLDVSAISSATITIGAGGAAAATGSHAGNAGSDTSFGAYCVAKGGAGGSAGASATAGNSYAGGSGGTVSGAAGDITLAGATGRTGSVQQGGRPIGGDGGASTFGDGGCGGVYLAAGSGAVPGTGGGGAGNSSNASGGAGADGIVIVWEYA